MKQFIEACILFCREFLAVLADVKADAEGSLSHPWMTQLEIEKVRKRGIDFGSNEELKMKRDRQIEALRNMARAYSRLLLSCSNYERTNDDLRFFECTFQFTMLAIKASVDPTPFQPKDAWAEIEQELYEVFRGPKFRPKRNCSDTSVGIGSIIPRDDSRLRSTASLHCAVREQSPLLRMLDL